MNPINSLDLPPGSVGAFFDDLPVLTTAHVRPFAIAILLHRGAVKPEEITAALVPHCRMDDLKVGGWDSLDNDWCEGTRLEKLINEVLGELVYERIVRYNEEHDVWVLTTSNISKIISWVTTLGARMPPHVLSEMSRQQIANLPSQSI